MNLIMELPKEFLKEVEKREKDRKEAIARASEKYAADRKKESEYWNKETEKKEDKLEICKKIFSWREEFLKTKEGKKLYERSGRNLWMFNSSKHGHQQEDVKGRWSRLYLVPKGVSYWPGYKWMPQESRKYETAEEMSKLRYDYLKDVWDEIEKGEVYEEILKWSKGR